MLNKQLNVLKKHSGSRGKDSSGNIAKKSMFSTTKIEKEKKFEVPDPNSLIGEFNSDEALEQLEEESSQEDKMTENLKKLK